MTENITLSRAKQGETSFGIGGYIGENILQALLTRDLRFFKNRSDGINMSTEILFSIDCHTSFIYSVCTNSVSIGCQVEVWSSQKILFAGNVVYQSQLGEVRVEAFLSVLFYVVCIIIEKTES